MTEFSVQNFTTQIDSRHWLWGPHGTDPGSTPSGTLDVSTLTQATHFPDGYVKSGLVLARNTVSLKFEAYKPAGTNGTDVAVGILYGWAKIPNLLDLTKDVGIAMLVHGMVIPSRLPIAAGAAGGGFLDADARTDLKLIHFGEWDAS